MHGRCARRRGNDNLREEVDPCPSERRRHRRVERRDDCGQPRRNQPGRELHSWTEPEAIRAIGLEYSPQLLQGLRCAYLRENEIVSVAASKLPHGFPPTVTLPSLPACASGARSRSRSPPAGPAFAKPAGTVTFARTTSFGLLPVSSAVSAAVLTLSVKDTRPYRVVARSITSGASPGASQSRGVALASQSVCVSGSSKTCIHFR